LTGGPAGATTSFLHAIISKDEQQDRERTDRRAPPAY
jgi:hypothetical protein